MLFINIIIWHWPILKFKGQGLHNFTVTILETVADSAN